MAYVAPPNPTHYVPAQTVENIVKECYHDIDTILTAVKTAFTTTMTTEEAKVAASKKVILDKYKLIPMFDKTGVLTKPTIAGMGGKDGAELEFGNLFAKYYAFSVLYNKIYDNAPFAVTANTTAPVLMALEPKINDLLQTIERIREFDEVKDMGVLSDLLQTIQNSCMEAKKQLYTKLNKDYATSAVYPSLEEKFSNKEMSYQIEPSGIQGSGRDSRFLFQDFLKSRGIDEDDEE